jgi:DNA-directed RNA polymerase subunit RPC12/RpoP
MGRAKEAWMENQEEQPKKDYLNYLLEIVDDSKKEGIIKLVLDKGEDVLSEKQQFVFNKIKKDYYPGKCKTCGEQISFEEALGEYDITECSDCRYRREKMEDE